MVTLVIKNCSHIVNRGLKMLDLKPIRVSKELIQEPLKFEKELGIRFFKECILKFNQIEDLDKEIIFSFEELRHNFNLKNPEDFKEFMRFFHTEIDGRKNVFTTDKGDLIGGGVFSTKIYVEENKIGAVVNYYHKQYIYSKCDIDKWHSVKGNPKEINKLEIPNQEKEKLLGLMTTFIVDGVKGKYSQRLLDLLMQFKGSGVFIMNYDKFKELLDIPKSYRASDIEVRIFEKSKEEFKKIGLLITDIEKVKEGRAIKNIKIKFKFEDKRKKAEKTNNSNNESLEKTDFTGLFGKIVMKIQKVFKNNWMNYMGELEECKTLEELEKFIEKYKLLDKKGELLNINSEI